MPGLPFFKKPSLTYTFLLHCHPFQCRARLVFHCLCSHVCVCLFHDCFIVLCKHSCEPGCTPRGSLPLLAPEYLCNICCISDVCSVPAFPTILRVLQGRRHAHSGHYHVLSFWAMGELRKCEVK